MKASLHWLNSYLSRPVTADDVDHLLTDQGLPIESVEPVPHSNGDEVLDVEVTSNRSDCLGHLGLARELAAGSGSDLIIPDCTLDQGSTNQSTSADANTLATVTNNELPLCPLYTARIIQGVQVGPSPDWLVQRLQSVGLRTVNNVVDVTNFVLMELGQPLHTFDLAKLQSHQVTIRQAAEGESFVAIDGSTHQLNSQMLVIADAAKPVAIAGIMGGQESQVTQTTQDILLESAIFERLGVRQTSRALKLHSDSSYRFERGVDPVGVETASRRAAKLICELTGGTLARGVIRLGMKEPAGNVVVMRADRCNALLGIQLSTSQMDRILARLGFGPVVNDAAQTITCTVPTYRLDVTREVDLIEEVARLHGLDWIPVNQRIHIIAQPVQQAVAAKQVLAQVLTAYGYHETITFSFVSPKYGQPFVAGDHQPLLIDDERQKSEPMLRPSLLPSLLACRKSNQDAGNTDVQLFENAATWSLNDNQVVERRRLGMICDATAPEETLRHVRGCIEELTQQLIGRQDPVFIPTDHRVFSIAADIQINGHNAGIMGLLSPETQQLFDLHTPLIAAELDLDLLLEAYPPTHQAKPVPRFPAIERDLSFIVDEQVSWAKVQQQVHTAKLKWLEVVCFVGVYRGKSIPEGQKSLTLRLVFRDPQRTLRHEQVDPQVQNIIDQLTKDIGAQLRA